MRHQGCLDLFHSGIDRAKTLCHLHDHAVKIFPKAVDVSDMLRAAVMIGVSAFDCFMHEIFKSETIARIGSGKSVKRLNLPFEVFSLPKEDYERFLIEHIDELNSYKSFIAPDKVSEALSCFVEAPWEKISQLVTVDSKTLKARLRTIADWRNRIAHEADLDPTYGRTTLWPILTTDVLHSLDELRELGDAIEAAIQQ